MTRKRFLDALLGLGGLSVTSVIAYPLIKFVNPPERSSESGEWVDAGTLEDLRKAGFLTIMHSTGIPLVLIPRSDEEVVALEKKCPHLGCMVELDKDEMICPCHGARFTLDGARVFGPSPRDLKRFAVEIRPDGHVFVGKEIA
jgi:cytochrome b6-f complex iron-sulfur subunit